MSQPQNKSSPKRVILLFKLQNDDKEILKAFLRHSHRPETEYEENKHHFHLDPARHEHLNTATAHIVIDIDVDQIEHPDLTTLPHEIYKVRLGLNNNL
jgi:hypothetical protein